jgi:hypothetical protein
MVEVTLTGSEQRSLGLDFLFLEIKDDAFSFSIGRGSFAWEVCLLLLRNGRKVKEVCLHLPCFKYLEL